MAPKQKKTMSIGESSRVQKRARTKENLPSEPPQDTQYSSNRFVNIEAEMNYKEYKKRPVLCERGIVLELFEQPPCNLLTLIMARGWQNWVKFQHKAIVPLVREYYSNVTNNRDPSGNRCLISHVRGLEIELRPSDIGEMFQIPREESMRAVRETDVNLEKDNLAKLLTGKGDAVWLGPSIPKALLTERNNVLHRLLCSHFVPQAFTGAVSLAQATFMGKILLDVHIDLPKHIFDIIDTVAKNAAGGSGLPFGGFITLYLLQKGVKTKAKYEVIHPKERISPVYTRRSRGQLKRLESQGNQDSENNREEALLDTQVQGPAEEYTLRGLYDMMRQMQENQEAMFTELKARQRVIYSGVMKVYDQYKNMERKVEQLLHPTNVETTPPPQETEKTDEERLEEAELCIKQTLDQWQRRSPPAQPPAQPSQPHAGIPTEASSDRSSGPTENAEDTGGI